MGSIAHICRIDGCRLDPSLDSLLYDREDLSRRDDDKGMLDRLGQFGDGGEALRSPDLSVAGIDRIDLPGVAPVAEVPVNDLRPARPFGRSNQSKRFGTKNGIKTSEQR